MKNIEAFTTGHGIASLTLSEIPYTKRAYVRIQASAEPELLLQDCLDFCRAVGAGELYAAGLHGEKYPLHTVVWQMCGAVCAIGQTDACLFPVTEATLQTWQSIYNEKIPRVPNGAWMTMEKGRAMLAEGSGYFVHSGGRLIGIGKASGGQIDWVASVVPGGGERVVQALCHALTEPYVHLEVASANEKAVRLYESLGFEKTAELSRWYKIL